MGAGPEQFARGGVEELLRAEGHDVSSESVEIEGEFTPEIKTAFGLCRLVAARVREARGEGRFPLVLSGNCNASLGSLAGLGSPALGLVWFDAHGDFNTPETTTGGFLDGMGLATATGRCWRRLAATVPGFAPLPDAHVAHVGWRDLDEEEKALLESSGVNVVSAERVKRSGVGGALAPALDALGGLVTRVYVHVDLDVLDPAEAPANEYGAKAPGGLGAAEVEEAIRLIGERLTICGGGFASFDPRYDRDGQTFRAGVRLMKCLLESGGG